jgi:hypothetical protein
MRRRNSVHQVISPRNDDMYGCKKVLKERPIAIVTSTAIKHIEDNVGQT